MPTPDFTQSSIRRREILRGLISISADRAENAIEPEDATNEAHGLILAYLREVVAAPDLADAFAGAVGVTEGQ